MESNKVFRIIDSNRVPPGRKTIKHRWVFEVKRNGTFRARLVACGYSQIPGVDYTEIYSPVLHDSTMRLLIALSIIKEYTTVSLDVERAFLLGKLPEEEKVYMETPQGIKASSNKCVVLDKALYGLTQAARTFFLTWTEVLGKIDFKQSESDPCLYVRNNENGKVYIGLYVDDAYMVGDPKAVFKAKEDIRKIFLIKKENFSDYLSCEIQFNEPRTMAWIGQPHLVKKLQQFFTEEVKNQRSPNTPGTPSFRITRPGPDDPVIDATQQKRYGSGVGMLLYLVKHSRPDIANAVRELSKSLDRSTPAAYKEMLRVVKYVLDTPFFYGNS